MLTTRTATRPDDSDPCRALDQIRLENDWSWKNLSDDILRLTKASISPACLCYVVQQAHLKHGPRDRTMYKITRYLAMRDTQKPRRRKKEKVA